MSQTMYEFSLSSPADCFRADVVHVNHELAHVEANGSTRNGRRVKKFAAFVSRASETRPPSALALQSGATSGELRATPILQCAVLRCAVRRHAFRAAVSTRWRRTRRKRRTSGWHCISEWYAYRRAQH